MSMTYSGDGITFSDGVQMPSYPQGWRSRIINGDMRIDQRNAGASVTITTDATYTLDRWSARCSVGSKYSVQQSTTAPAGFINSALITSLSAYSISATDIFTYDQKIEGVNVSDLGWGTADAQPITISFRVRSSLTGTFGGVVQNSAQNRSYPFSYTINAANTFETKTVTIAGDTSGTWLTNTGVGLFMKFGLGVGSTYSGTAGAWAGADYRSATGATSVVGTNGATFYITGVMLEKGSFTGDRPYDYVEFGESLRRCQRYYYRMSPGGADRIFTSGGNCETTTGAYGAGNFPVTMRTIPSAFEQSGTASDYKVFHSAGSTVCSSVPTMNAATTNYAYVVNATVASGLTAYRPANIAAATSAGYLGFSAEL